MRKLLLIVLYIFSFLTAFAQMDTEFWFAVPNLCEHTAYQDMGSYHFILFAEDKEAEVTISMPANSSFTPIHTIVAANGYQDVEIARDYNTAQSEFAVPFDIVSRRALLIQSDALVYCYFQVTGANSEAYTLKGNKALGTDFYVLSQNSAQNSRTQTIHMNSYHCIEILATEDNTNIDISPSHEIGASCSTGSFSITLQRGETYAFRACSNEAEKHLNGTKIVSNKPIAVNSTDDTILDPILYSGGDLAADQLTPTDYWGTEYIAVNNHTGYDALTITAKENNTYVTCDDGTSFVLNEGESRNVPFGTSNTRYVQSDKPVGVWQLTGEYVEAGGTNLPATTKCTGSSSVKYKRLADSYNIIIHILTLTSNVSHFTLNGSPIAATEFHTVDGTNSVYSYASIDATYMTSELVSVECTSGLFHMGVVDAVSGSCTYGFFSDYSIAHEYDEYGTFDEGSYFTWQNHFLSDGVTPQTFTVEGIYKDILTDRNGCDSICVLHLQKTHSPDSPFTYDILTHPQCADDPFVEFELQDPDGLIHQLQFAFSRKALEQHFRDTIVTLTNPIIQIPNRARAGIYDVAINALYNQQIIDTRNYKFSLLYPSSVLDQHWDDFIGVLTHDYNGGYDFIGFQWYKNGSPIAGENHSYLYQPLEMGTPYSAMLEEADGTKLMTCEIIATHQTEILIYPTLSQPHQIIRLHSSEDVTIWLYDSFGKLLYTNSFERGDNQFAAPQDPGIYIVKIQQTGEHGKSETKKLIIR